MMIKQSVIQIYVLKAHLNLSYNNGVGVIKNKRCVGLGSGRRQLDRDGGAVKSPPHQNGVE